jgi:hypothetical protein
VAWKWLLRIAPVVVAIVVAPSADAAFPGKNGRIAFEQNSGISLVNPDGSVETPLTPADGSHQPAFSADGSRIAFRGPGFQVWSMNSDGSDKTQLTEHSSAIDHPAFSPDGERIVFVSGLNTAGTHIWVMDADGSNETQLTTTVDNRGNPSFSPDGTQIVYDTIDEIRVMNADGSGDRLVVAPSGNVSDPDWSPDGTQVVFHGFADDAAGEIYLVDVTGGALSRLTSDTSVSQHPVFSPDGEQIAFFGRNAQNESAIFTMDVGGSVAEELTTSHLDARPSWGSLPAAAPPPRPGVSANVATRAGTVLVKQPSSNRFVRVRAETQIPIGSLVDTTQGTVELTTARGGAGAIQKGTFRGGVFKVGQKRGGNPLTTLTLGGPGLRCGGRGGNLASAGKRKRSRRLRGNTRGGRFRTRGRHSTATVRGTKWLTKDTCKGTLTVVRQGVVVVRDLRKRRTKTLRKGQRYLARAPKRR